MLKATLCTWGITGLDFICPDSQAQKTELWMPSRGGKEEAWGGPLGLADEKYYRENG